jgi:hypothetical protein
VNIGQRTRVSLHPVARWFVNEARASRIRVPVVIGEVMKARMGERATEPIAAPVLASLERYDQIERASGDSAPAHCNDTGIGIAFRRAYAAIAEQTPIALDLPPVVELPTESCSFRGAV